MLLHTRNHLTNHSTMGDIPDEEKIAIATHYVLSSPPNEVKEVLADIKVIIHPPTLLNDGFVRGVLRKYNTQNFEVVDCDGTLAIVSDATELDAKHYIATNNTVVCVDHAAQKGTKTLAENAPKISAGSHESLRAAVQTSLDEYCATQFAENSTVATAVERDGNIIVVLSGNRANLRSYWTGKWRSEWTVDTKGKTASGKVHIVVHYFEDGNVQLDQSKIINKTAIVAKGSDDKAMAEGIREFIRKGEADIQDTLEDMYNNMSQETFKDMRRILPITKTKFDWSGAQMKMAATMGKPKQ